MRQLLATIRNGFDDMTYEQKRAAIRTIVRRIIWDGENAHIVLFGAQDGEIEYPDISSLMQNSVAETEEDEDLVPFGDENEDEDGELGSKTHLREDSK